MPLYAFRCESCKHEQDYLMGTKNYRVPKCEKCGEKMARVYSVGGVIFKGDGWPGKNIKQGRRPI